MTQWADRLISAVRFNAAGTHIDKVLVHNDNGDTVSDYVQMDRASVILLMKNGNTFGTIYKKADGKWYFGAKVGIVIVNGNEYIRTHADGTPSDNLDNLERF